MEESADRKTLKDVLAKLKTKSMQSKAKSEYAVKDAMETYDFFIKKINALAVETKDTSQSAAFVAIGYTLQVLQSTTKETLLQLSNALESVSLYSETLEKYSIELDSTLTSIFEQATKQAEEQIKKQEEAMKGKDKAYMA